MNATPHEDFVQFRNLILERSALAAKLNATVLNIGDAMSFFPRKHRINPDDADHPAAFAEGSYELLTLAREALIAALELNQRATPPHPDRECLTAPIWEPIQQAAGAAMAREIQRRLDSARSFLIRHGLEAPPETLPRTAGGEGHPIPESTGNSPSGDCLPPSTTTEH
ncbi:MAG TPA: hypothetical protein VF258_08725 [Luteolibacter sp.]